MGWMQLNSWWQIFTLISKGELHGILLGMITWWVVQLKLEREQRHWHPLTIFFEGWRYNTIRNRTPNQGDWGWGGGGGGGGRRGSYSSWKKMYSCPIPAIDPNGTSFAYLAWNATSLLTAVDTPFLSINHWTRKMTLLALQIRSFYIPQWNISLPFHI